MPERVRPRRTQRSGSGRCAYPSFRRWLLPPLQTQSFRSAPSPVESPVTSGHSQGRLCTKTLGVGCPPEPRFHSCVIAVGGAGSLPRPRGQCLLARGPRPAGCRSCLCHRPAYRSRYPPNRPHRSHLGRRRAAPIRTRPGVRTRSLKLLFCAGQPVPAARALVDIARGSAVMLPRVWFCLSRCTAYRRGPS